MIHDLSTQKGRNEYVKAIEGKTTARFFQAVLKEVKGDVLEHVYGKNHNMTITERMGNKNGTCPECGCNSWILLPKESSAVSQGGKPYIECMECGTSSHL